MYTIVSLSIKGKNINNLIKKLRHNNIEILKLKQLSYKEVIIDVYYKDYNTIIKNKTIYEISIIKYKGLKQIKDNIISKRYFLISCILGIILFTILLNITFNIEIITNNNYIKELLIKELKRNNIKKYSLVKNYNEIEKIKKDIIDRNRNEIEWLEIERIGTKYIVRVEPRKIVPQNNDNKIYNIVSKKDAIIKKIESSQGNIIKEINNYVKKGDIVISSEIKLNEEIKGNISAKGTIYGEVWYQVKVEYPLNYYEEKYTGISKQVYTLKFINNYYNFNSLKSKKIEDKIILRSNLIPLSFIKQTQREIEIINYKLNQKEAVEKALEEGRKKIQKNLKEKEYIISENNLKIEMKDSKIELDMFYSVYENVTEYVEKEE